MFPSCDHDRPGDRDPLLLAYCNSVRTAEALREGRFDDVETLLEAVAEGIGDRRSEDIGFHARAAHLYGLRRLQGGLGELEPILARGADAYPLLPLFRCALARARVAAGDADGATAILREVCGDGRVRLPPQRFLSVSLGILAEVAAVLCDAQAAELLYRRLAPWSGLYLSPGGLGSHGCADRALGLLAEVLERCDDAVAHLERAVQTEREMGSRAWEAEALWALARASEHRGAGARADAQRLARDAETLARDLGMRDLLAEIEADH